MSISCNGFFPEPPSGASIMNISCIGFPEPILGSQQRLLTLLNWLLIRLSLYSSSHPSRDNSSLLNISSAIFKLTLLLTTHERPTKDPLATRNCFRGKCLHEYLYWQEFGLAAVGILSVLNALVSVPFRFISV